MVIPKYSDSGMAGGRRTDNLEAISAAGMSVDSVTEDGYVVNLPTGWRIERYDGFWLYVYDYLDQKRMGIYSHYEMNFVHVYEVI